MSDVRVETLLLAIASYYERQGRMIERRLAVARRVAGR
jgi:hypothetical protein